MTYLTATALVIVHPPRHQIERQREKDDRRAVVEQALTLSVKHKRSEINDAARTIDAAIRFPFS